MTSLKADKRIVGSYAGKDIPTALVPLVTSVLGILPEGYQAKPYMHAGEFPRVDIMIPGEKERVCMVEVDDATGTFVGLGNVQDLPAPASDMQVAPGKPKPAPKAPKAKVAQKRKLASQPKPKPKAAPKKVAAAKDAVKAISAPAAAIEAVKAKTKKVVAAKKAAVDPKVSKTETIIALLSRPQGATPADIAQATGWQAHSIRGAVATLKTKRGLNVVTTKTDAGQVFKIEPVKVEEELV